MNPGPIPATNCVTCAVGLDPDRPKRHGAKCPKCYNTGQRKRMQGVYARQKAGETGGILQPRMSEAESDRRIRFYGQKKRELCGGDIQDIDYIEEPSNAE